VWYADFYHHLIGDGNYGDNYAKLLKNAGYGTTSPLNMDYFAGALLATPFDKIVYHENHDEAGNESNTERTIVTAVNRAPLTGATRNYAEGRSRFAAGLAALSAGTPMFLMGEDIGAARYFRYNDFFLNSRKIWWASGPRRKVPVPFLSGSHSAGDRQPGGAVPRPRCHLSTQRQSRDCFHA
jgi:1,4-alpha-glucan branching enzyme